MKTQAFYTAIISEDYEKSLRFYTDVLGFTVKHRVNRPVGEVSILENGEGARIEIFAPLKNKELAKVHSDPGFHALRTNVKDLDAAIAEFREKGVEIVSGPVEIGTGRAVVVKDPAGVLITVIQHIHKD